MNIALIFAGGTGSRMHTKTLPKQFITICGKPIIMHTIELFELSPFIDEIVVVTLKDYINFVHDQCLKFGIKKCFSIVEGGSTGAESITKGLKEINHSFNPLENDLVLISDGVRPMVSQEVIKNNIEIARKTGNCITVAPVSETIVTIKDNTISNIGPRSSYMFAKAPQTFKIKAILSLYERAINDNYTAFVDSASLANHYGCKLNVTECEDNNIKITNRSDLIIFRDFIEEEENKKIINDIADN